ncbi:MAG: ABC-F family ATP-binding cassette domain-containing protein [Candidatus Dojkabacteria bacterium]|nr:ABC-F family ATP-binding cassette domain-containing protein [Candidatus Dojkabacteria bacterium]
MSYIVVENLKKDILSRNLFENINFSIAKNEKIALVAENGKGKSTILKILAGVIEYDKGDITTQNGIHISYLSQNPDLEDNNTLNEELRNTGSKFLKAVSEYEEAIQDINDPKRLELAMNEMNRLNAWEYENVVSEVLERLKLSDYRDEKISSFSGGQKKRLALVKILLDEADVLLLDEPTNHLDIEMIEWLGNYLRNLEASILLVTHDRYFLDKVCNTILELDRGQLYKHIGNYTQYLEYREKRRLDENINIDKTRTYLKREYEIISKQPQGRQSKDGARIRDNQLARENLGSKNTVDKVSLDVVSDRLGSKILELHNVSKSFGEKKILDKFTYTFEKGSRIGIIGENGAGKSTFLDLILGKKEIDGGKIVKGETVNFGYYSQHQEELNPNLTIIDSINEVASEIKLSDGKFISAGKMLERFLFSGTIQRTKIEDLSGGERKRVALLKVLMNNPNFLILDEPTNDFDLMTLEVLEEFLINFKGCVIIVSHDRYFIDTTVDHLLVFKGDGEIDVFPGNYSDFINKKGSDKPKDPTPKVAVVKKSESDEKR